MPLVVVLASVKRSSYPHSVDALCVRVCKSSDKTFSCDTVYGF